MKSVSLLMKKFSSFEPKTRNSLNLKCLTPTKTESTKASLRSSGIQYHKKAISQIRWKDRINNQDPIENNKDNKSLPKILYTEQNKKQMISIFNKGLTLSSINDVLLTQNNEERESKNKRSKKKAFFNKRHIHSEQKQETFKEFFNKYSDKAYSSLKTGIETKSRNNRLKLQNDNNKMFSTDFKLIKDTDFTKEFRLMDHADMEYDTLTKDKGMGGYLKKIRRRNPIFALYQKNVQVIQNIILKEKLSPLQLAISQSQHKPKKELYSKWKHTIGKAADHFKRCHLNLNDLYSGKYTFLSPYQVHNSKEFFMSIKNADIKSAYLFLADNKYLFHQTAIHLAAKRNQYSLISDLIYFGGDMNAKDCFGRTPLHLAVINKCFESILVLLNEIASLDIKDKNNKTPVQYTNDRKVIAAFKRASLLDLIHSMGKKMLFKENYQRGFQWFIYNEIRMRDIFNYY